MKRRIRSASSPLHTVFLKVSVTKRLLKLGLFGTGLVPCFYEHMEEKSCTFVKDMSSKLISSGQT